MVTSYQREQCLEFIKECYPNISHVKTCNVLNCSRTNIYYQKKMPFKDLKTKEDIEAVLGTTRLGRKKVIVKHCCPVKINKKEAIKMASSLKS